MARVQKHRPPVPLIPLEPAVSPLAMGIYYVRYVLFASFPILPLPAPDLIVSHQCPECWKVRDDFVGRRWPEVSYQIIDYHHDSLPLFTVGAHRYYLPAFLSRALSIRGDMAGTVLDFAIHDLCPDDEKWWHQRFDGFTPGQKHAVAQWLGFILAHDDLFCPDIRVGRRGYTQFWHVYEK